MFGAFNAALNGRSNVECVTGDLFSAVPGQCFDLVLSNPPFVLSPGNHFLFRDNPLELDGFCRQLIEQVGDDLNEGGLCRLICEWVEVTGQSWQDRLAEWFDGAGCDVWVLSANRQSPSTYARDWVYVTRLYSGEDLHQRYDAWLGHLVRHNVEAIHGRLIFLRRRTGANWVSFDQIEEGSDGRSLGAAAERGFAVRDFLQAHRRDADLFGARLRIVAGVRLEYQASWQSCAWQPDSTLLRVDGGMPVRVALDVNVRSLIERLERFNDFAAAIEDFASQIGLPAGDVQRECLRNLTPIAGAGLFDPRLNFEMDTGGGCVAGPLRRQQVDADGRPGAIMGKQKIKREGPGFLIYTSKPKARRGVLQTFSQLTNQRASTQLMVRYTTADQFPGYLSKRLEITTLLARYTLYFRFVWLPGPASVYVSGAAAQVGTGTSTTPTRGADGGVVYNGLDASHVRLGTYTVNGDAVSLSWPARIFELAKRRGVPRGQISEVFPANVSMASVAMMYDAVTDYTDALLNRVFGKVEDYTHQAMRVLVPPTTPANAAELEQYQIRFTEAFPSLVAKMMKRYARLRLGQLAAADAKQASQAVPADGTVAMFRCESDILKAMMMQLDDARSETMAALDAMVARARGDIRDEVADAVAARVEVTGPSSV